MNDTGVADVPSGLLEACVEATSHDARAAILDEAGLLTRTGLLSFLDATEASIHISPADGSVLAESCSGFARRMGEPLVAARASYLAARAHAMTGRLDTALELIEAARDGYEAIDEDVEAARTNLGMMHILNELGRHHDALAAGDELEAAAARAEKTGTCSADEATTLRARLEQNRGACWEHMGRYADALDSYTAAEDGYRSVAYAEGIGDVANNRGIVLLAVGRAREALDAFRTAAAIRGEADAGTRLGGTLANIGTAHMALGEYAESLEVLEKARRVFERAGEFGREPLLHLDMADTYLALNLFPEAVAAYREAERILDEAGMNHHRAAALLGLGSAFIAQGRLAEADAALATAADMYHAAGNAPLSSQVKLEQSALEEAWGHPDAAKASAREAFEMASENVGPVQRLFALMRLADLSMTDPAAAAAYLDTAEEAAQVTPLPPLRHRIRQRRGRLALVRGDLTDARDLLEEAVADVERQRGKLRSDLTRSSFVTDKIAPYEDLVRLHLDTDTKGGALRAFEVAERARARSLLDRVAGTPSRTMAVNPGASDVAVLEADLHALYDRILALGTADQAEARTLIGRTGDLESQIGRLRLRADGNDNGTSVSSPLRGEEILATVPEDTSLLVYFTAGDEILAFHAGDGHFEVHRNVSSVRYVTQLVRELSIQWERIRAGSTFASRHGDMLRQSADRVLRRMYDALVGSVGLPPSSAGARKLAVVPHGVLHRVPFHALFDGERYVIDDYEVGYAPSATLFTAGNRTRTDGHNLVVGVPDPLIPAVSAEVRAVAARLTTPTIKVGTEATIATVVDAASHAGIVHLACHGIFRSDNPLFSALKLRDGWLKAADIAELDLPGTLVTLSACESGKSSIAGGDEVLGLARAFLSAGAGTVVVSSWLLQDDTMPEFMGDLYDAIRLGVSPSSALRTAQIKLRKHHPHPFRWAPLMAIGDCFKTI
ncbi:MAG: CHAT domain-containing protein [Acidimicrobiia bacterium]